MEKQIKINDKIYSYSVTHKDISKVYLRFKNGKISVSAPYLTPNFIIESFIKKNADWIIKNDVAKPTNKLVINDNSFIKLIDKLYLVKFSDHNLISEDTIYLNKKNLVKNFYKMINEILVDYASSKINYYFNKMLDNNEFNCLKPLLKIKMLKSRWGSYNRLKHEVTLNLCLVFEPSNYIDYVIVHELSHIKEMNHQSGFHTLLEKYYPNHLKVRKEMHKCAIIYSKEDIVVE